MKSLAKLFNLAQKIKKNYFYIQVTIKQIEIN